MVDSNNEFDLEIQKYKDIYSGNNYVFSADSNFEDPTNGYYGDGTVTTHVSLPIIIDTINRKKRAVSILDYGCGQAKHTFEKHTKINSFLSYSDNIYTLLKGYLQCYYCYDPAVAKYNVKPSKGTLFDVTMMIDVGEHIPEAYVESVIKELFDYTKEDGVVIVSVSGSPSQNYTTEGSSKINLHINLKSADWWVNVVDKNRGGKAFVLLYHRSDDRGGTNKMRYIKHNSKYMKLPDTPTVLCNMDCFNFVGADLENC